MTHEAERTSARIAVVSTGAVGGTVGGLLLHAGYDVTFADQWAPQADALKSTGLRVVVGPQEEPLHDVRMAVRAYGIDEFVALADRFDIILFCCKSYDSDWLLPRIEPRLADDGVLVAMQNGFNDRYIASVVGEGRALGCALTGGAQLLEPGLAWRHHDLDRRYATIGELDGSLSPRAEEVASILTHAGSTKAIENIAGAKWSKLVANSASASLSSLVSANLRASELTDLASYRDIFRELGREAIELGKQLDFQMEPIFGLTADELMQSPANVLDRLISAAGENRIKGAINMIQQDLQRGRPTEVSRFLNGFIALESERLGMDAPVNSRLAEMFAKLERKEISPSPEHLQQLVEAMS